MTSRAIGSAFPLRRRTAVVSLLVAIAILSRPIGPTAEATSPIAVGSEAPEIQLGDQHGRPFVLSDALKQRAFVVLAFYPKAFTSG